MNWFLIGGIVLIILIGFLGLFFWSSGAVNIDSEEKKDIERKTPEELVDELIEIEKEDLAELHREESETRGFR
ncbi:MAG TPA: hypothetical protein VG984_02990 [Candidatus Paceibacterota bacterium]|nr:hypothetical protein [Candidatus Paceibacterota bacterium]